MIELYTRKPGVAKMVVDVIDSMVRTPYVVYRTTEYLKLPNRADYIVTTTNDTADVQRFAASRGAMAVVLPEASDWLGRKLALEHDAVLIGFDYARKR